MTDEVSTKNTPSVEEHDLRLALPVPISEQNWAEATAPLVSICCVTYNHAAFIRECLDGFMMQETTFPVEILIHDDASTDNTANIIREYVVKYPKIVKPIYQTDNQFSQGRKPNLSFNYPRAQGKYIAICEGDDYWTDPAKLQIQAEFLENNPDYVICYHNAKVIDSYGNVISQSRLPDNFKKDFTSEELMMGAWILNLTRLFRNVLGTPPAEIFRVINGDTFHTVLLGRYGKGKYLSQVKPAMYRKHAGGIWSCVDENKKLVNSLNTYLQIYQYHLDNTGKEFAQDFLLKLAWPCLMQIDEATNPIKIELIKQQERYDQVLRNIRDSPAYIIGNALLWPLKKIRHLLRRATATVRPLND